MHRWINAISEFAPRMGRPGIMRDCHMPAPVSDPGLYLVGDYLFDCTINGVFDSAEYVS